MKLKRKRLPGGNWITQKLVESSPETLAKAKPEEIWTTGDGRRVTFRDMESRHLMNVVLLLRARIQTSITSLGAAGIGIECEDYAKEFQPQYLAAHNELEIRLGIKPREPKKVTRKFDFAI